MPPSPTIVLSTETPARHNVRERQIVAAVIDDYKKRKLAVELLAKYANCDNLTDWQTTGVEIRVLDAGFREIVIRQVLS